MARMTRWARKVHRVSAYFVGLQVLLWIAGGLIFAWVPFDSIVKGGAVVQEIPAPPLPDAWPRSAAQALAETGPVRAVASHASAQGPLLRLATDAGDRWLRLDDGALDTQASAAQVARFADQVYRGDGAPAAPRYLDEVETRVLGLVDELYGRTGVWQVPFDDFYRTRLYFDGDTGRYLTVRNDFWVLYDAMWRLHIMDYSTGEDFNNPLLTVFSAGAAIFALSGLVLLVLALQRALRGRAR